MTAPTDHTNPPRRPPWWAARLGRLILRLAIISRLWPVRLFTRGRFLRWGACDFFATSQDGLTIHGLYLPAHRPSADAPGTPPGRKLPVVILHGWLETKEFHAHQARLLQLQGHDVILIDHPCHGRSSGDVVTFGPHEVCALTAVIDHAQRHGWFGPRVLTVGFSLGAATALQHAAQDPRVAAVVAVAPFRDLPLAIESFCATLAPWLNRRDVLAGIRCAATEHQFSIDQSSTHQAVAASAIPILFIAGDSDRLLPADQHVVPLHQIQRPAPSRLLRIPGAGHLSLCLLPWPDVDQAIVAFLNEQSPACNEV